MKKKLIGHVGSRQLNISKENCKRHPNHDNVMNFSAGISLKYKS